MQEVFYMPHDSLDNVINDLQNAEIEPPLQVSETDDNWYEIRSRIMSSSEHKTIPLELVDTFPAMPLYVMHRGPNRVRAIKIPARLQYKNEPEMLEKIHEVQSVIEKILENYGSTLEPGKPKPPLLTRVLDSVGLY